MINLKVNQYTLKDNEIDTIAKQEQRKIEKK